MYITVNSNNIIDVFIISHELNIATIGNKNGIDPNCKIHWKSLDPVIFPAIEN